MSKKQDSFYFENFIACTQLSCQAAHLLEQAMEHFDPAQLPQKLAIRMGRGIRYLLFP